nr:MAG TPA: hydrolase [Bacteriophage sp.]
MGNWNDLKQAVAQVIRENGNQEITGQILQDVLNSIISNVGQHATFVDIATPSTNPGTPDGNVFYIASQAGTYANFGGIEIDGSEACVLLYNGTSWLKKSAGIATIAKVSELEIKTCGVSRSFNFSPENYTANFSDIKLKAGIDYIVYAETDNSNSFIISCTQKYNYLNGQYSEEGQYANVKIVNGKGFSVIKNDTDTNLGSWGFASPSAAKTASVNFKIYTTNSLATSVTDLEQSVTDLEQSVSDIDNELTDIRGYKQVNSKVIKLSSTQRDVNLQFPITANKKYLLKVDCSEPYNTLISGNPPLNYIDDNYYADGQYPCVELTNGQGSIILGNDTDTKLSHWGFSSDEISAMYKGDYTFTLFELSDADSESLISLRQSITDLEQSINDFEQSIQPIAKTNGFIRIFHSMGVIGDSLSSGEIVTGSGTDDDPNVYNDRYNFSWLANIARKYGADWKCFSNGGQTAKGWLGQWLSDLTSEENKRSLYFIALGTNDKGLINKGQLALGTKDSNSDEASFAGYYKKIIESVHAYSEHSIIMCCTTYGKETVLSDINNLIQEISNLYDYCYFVNISQKSTFNLGGEYTRGGHFDTFGYVKFADALEVLINDVLEENKTKLATWGVDAPN